MKGKEKKWSMRAILSLENKSVVEKVRAKATLEGRKISVDEAVDEIIETFAKQNMK